MSEELLAPYTGPMSKETAQFRARQAVDYYHKKLNTQKVQPNVLFPGAGGHQNGYERPEKVLNTDGRHSSASVTQQEPSDGRFVRGGHRATVHGTQSAHPRYRQPPHNNHTQQTINEHRSASKKRFSRGLHRSNSNLEESMEYINVENLDMSFSSKREYGSTSSLDMMNASTSSDSFFAMLENLKPESVDQRSPAPSKLKEVLRGTRTEIKDKNLLRNLEQIANGSVIPSRQGLDEVDDGTSSPRTKAKFKKERKLRSKSITPETGPGVWKRIRGRNEQELVSRTSDNMSDTELKGDDRFRRKAFVHYDSQSIGFDINKVAKRKSSLVAFSNISTGASAASGTRESYAGEAEDPDIVPSVDDGDGRSNNLVHSCSFFRNEIGGEEERTISLTNVTASKQAHSQSRDTNHNTRAIVYNRSPHCCGVTILDSTPTPVGHILPPHITHKGHVIEFMDTGAYYYRHFFNGTEHQNYCGVDDNLGPVVVSVKREKLDERENHLGKSESGLYHYRLILRTSELCTLRGAVLEDAIPASGRISSSRGIPVRDLLEFLVPEVQTSCLRQATAGQKTADQIIKLDEQKIFNTYKIGILYCKAGQSSEEDMYNNEHGGPAFEEFLNLIGQKVRLKGFEKYRAQLDNKTDSTGTHSVYTTFNSAEIMFHVSTLLPFTPKNNQQLLRKRHIGNDIVTIVFQEPGSLPFTAKNVRSQFQHVFIIVRVHNPCSEKTSYSRDILTANLWKFNHDKFQCDRTSHILENWPVSELIDYTSVAVSRSKDVPAFGPPIPENARFPKSTEFADFLLAKVINGENAAHYSEKFSAMAVRTRQEYLKDLATNYVTSNSLESASKLSKFALSGKKKEKHKGKVVPDNFALGAIVWHVQVEDIGQNSAVACYLGIAAETIVIVEEESKSVIATTHCGSVIGWTSQAISLKLYYQQGECLVLRPISGDMEELQEIVSRLSAVTFGCETVEMSLKRNGLGQLGFHIQAEGIVTEVEQYGFAFEAGLRKGSRLVEICKVATVTLTHDQMVDLLRTSATVKVVVIPPLKDGGPRGVVNLHANHHYSSFPALNAVIQAEFTHHQRQARSSSSSSDQPPPSPAPFSTRDTLLFPASSTTREFSPRDPFPPNSTSTPRGDAKDRRFEDFPDSSDTDHRESYHERWELREIKRKLKNSSQGSRDSQESRHSVELQDGAHHERESSVSSSHSQSSQRSSNTLPHQKKSSASSTSSTDHRGEMKSPPSRTFYMTDSQWHTSSFPRNSTTTAATAASSTTTGYHGYQDSTVSSGRGSLFEGREDQYGSSSRGLDDSSYGTLEEKHTRSGSRDSLDNGTYGSSRDWSSSRPQRPPPPQGSHYQESSVTSHTTYLTGGSSDNLYTSSSGPAPPPSARKQPPPSVPPGDYSSSVQHGNYAQELLKQSQNTKYLLGHSQGQGEPGRREGGNSLHSQSANSSSINLSDTSFSSGGSGQTGSMPQQPAAHGDQGLYGRDEGQVLRRRANTAATSHGIKPHPAALAGRNPGISPLSSEHSSPRTSHKNLSGMSSEESLSTRLRPGVTTRLTKAKGTSNLQDDLIRLIDPDVPDSDIAGLLSSRSSSRRLSGRLVRTMSDESLHSGKAGLAPSIIDDDLREALFPSRPKELRASQEQLKQNRLSPRATSSASSRIAAAVSGVPMPESTASLDWTSLVNVATKAIEGSDTEPGKDRISSPANSNASSSTNQSMKSQEVKGDSLYRTSNPPTGSNPPVWRSVVANPGQRIQELETKVASLEEELAQERQESAALDLEVQRLRNENARLQEESQTAAAQLRRFTEWFFTTIDRQ